MSDNEEIHMITFDMDDARKAAFKACSDRIIEVCRREFGLSPFEAFAVIKLCLMALADTYDIQETIFMKPPTDKTQ